MAEPKHRNYQAHWLAHFAGPELARGYLSENLSSRGSVLSGNQQLVQWLAQKLSLISSAGCGSGLRGYNRPRNASACGCGGIGGVMSRCLPPQRRGEAAYGIRIVRPSPIDNHGLDQGDLPAFELITPPAHRHCRHSPSVSSSPLGTPRSHGAVDPGRSYVAEKIVSASHRLNAGLSLNCLNSSVSSFINPIMTFPSALSCSMRAFCLSEFCFAF